MTLMILFATYLLAGYKFLARHCQIQRGASGHTYSRQKTCLSRQAGKKDSGRGLQLDHPHQVQLHLAATQRHSPLNPRLDRWSRRRLQRPQLIVIALMVPQHQRRFKKALHHRSKVMQQDQCAMEPCHQMWGV